MKFFVAFAALVAVAVASPVKRVVPDTIAIGPAIVDASPIAIGPAIIDPSPISIGPAIIDFPVPESALAPTVPVVPSPVVIGDLAPGQPAPLVQLVVNVNGVPYPISINEPTLPVQIVDEAVDAPVVVDPVQVVDLTPVIVDPVQVVDVMPVVVEPVQIGTPVIPSPAVNLPDELN